MMDDPEGQGEIDAPGAGLASAEDPGPAFPGMDAPKGPPDPGYQVLARKYRPQTFEDLIGQEPMVRTLKNAFAAGRIAHAYMLTGVRGIGKTTTARLIARALNYETDTNDAPSVILDPPGRECAAIARSAHVDVMEMDAASRTGVGDIREILEGVRYAPVSARYKVYIIDEVHMLSTSAFNALLKTLEEPPPHVKFIFATTEIRKVPVTVISRCQRFDLRRVPVEQLSAHFRRVTEAEGMSIDDEALAMISRAADGSVRDGLSILDQAIALSSNAVDAERVRDMLGLADRARIYDLFDSAMQGDAPGALGILESLYDVGADPAVVIQDLLDVTHWLTRAKIVPDLLDRATTPELERTRGKQMADTLSMPILSRAWQMLLKGLGEVREAPAPIQAAEMVLIRLIHAADMPSPGDLIKKLSAQGGSTPAAGPAGGGGSGAGTTATATAMTSPPTPAPTPAPSQSTPPQASADGGGGGPQAAVRPAPQPMPEAEAEAVAGPIDPPPNDFKALVDLVAKRKELRMASSLRRHVHPVAVERGRLEIRLAEGAPRELKDLPGQLGRKLTDWTGERWVVSLSNAPGQATIVEEEKAGERARLSRAEADPLVQAIKSAFPGAEIVRVSGSDDGDPADVRPDNQAAGDGQMPDAPPFDEDGSPLSDGDEMPPPWEDDDPGPFQA